MPFGLSSCPSVFMLHINAVFRDLIAQSIVLPYMDDLVIIATNGVEALEHLTTVLKLACDYGLQINFNKCIFLHNIIEFLGQLIDHNFFFHPLQKLKPFLNIRI